ncbi:DUF992 domain-containing protein [Segnochrobactraceae bacterium EtOH-i3]
MSMKKLIAVAALVAAGVAASAPAFASDKINIGVLSCREGKNLGFIIGSTTSLACTFKPAGGAPEQTYSGTISEFGIDIGETKAAQIVWGVLAPTNKVVPGGLAGQYGGLSAEATVTVGLGANVLLGGFEKSIALQPLSTQVQEGFNIAAGISSMTLTYVP